MELSAQDEILARIAPSSARRFLALATLYALGLLQAWLGFSVEASALATVIPFAFAVIVLAIAEKMRRSTRSDIVLTTRALWDGDGTLIADLDTVERVERGAFAIKPSNGFMLLTRDKARRDWRPGMWWRTGRRVGVGGILAAGAARFMAEQIAAQLALRGRG